jgi:hypothetical protein
MVLDLPAKQVPSCSMSQAGTIDCELVIEKTNCAKVRPNKRKTEKNEDSTGKFSNPTVVSLRLLFISPLQF